MATTWQWIAAGLAILALPAGTAGAEPAPAPVAATYVGGAACVPCHPAEAERWRGSHHDLAMQPAKADTVRGGFTGTTFVKDGVTSTFLRRGGRYLVRTDGPDGRLAEYPVAYTFGVEPLQQYLLPLSGGRLQALSIVWDTRPAAAGGQRWFHLHPKERIDHRDVLHWTGPAQNWNHMCAECHSTNVRKGYRAAEDRFDTTWTDVDVSCEACHGPGSRHVAWAEARRGGGAPDDPRHGLVVALEDGFNRAWSSIRDSNISTLITCVILYWFGDQFGESAIKSFALTLGSGVVISMFSAIIVTRTFMYFVIGIRPIARRTWLFAPDLPDDTRRTGRRVPAMAGGSGTAPPSREER